MSNGLSQFDDTFQPMAPGRTPNVDALADGEYTMEIISAELVTTPKTGEAILRWIYKIHAGESYVGNRIEAATFFRNAEACNMLGADLLVLGIPTNDWKASAGKPFSKMLPECLPGLSGIHFAATKISRVVGSKTYHNIRIKTRTEPAAMPSEPLPF